MTTKKRKTPPQADAVTVELVSLASLTALDKNPRHHDARDLAYLRGVVERVGSARSGVIDQHGVVLAGNGFRAAAAAAGQTEAIIVDSDGRRPVFVRRRDLSDAQKDELVVADNRAAQLSTWDTALLAAYADRSPDARLGWTDQEWAELIPPAAVIGLTDPELVPDQRPTSIVTGDLFELGPHRLLCGDATAAADVTRVLGTDNPPSLMATNPPYGFSYDPAVRGGIARQNNPRKLGKVTNDARADWFDAWALFPGSVAYVYHGALKGNIMQAALERAGFSLRAQIIWAKDRMALSRGDYHWQHEPCWYAVRDGGKSARTADRTQTTIWRIKGLSPRRPRPHGEPTTTIWEIPAREDSGHGHGTQKPVECLARPMRNHDAPVVYDPFVGSGTSLIAATLLARRCVAIEIEPAYVQIAIDRWEAFTGLKAVKVGDAPAPAATPAKARRRG